MTKEKIIETIVRHTVGRHFGEYREITQEDCEDIADELLEFINKELSERLEKLHTEMDERMREEVAIEKRMGEKKAEIPIYRVKHD